MSIFAATLMTNSGIFHHEIMFIFSP